MEGNDLRDSCDAGMDVQSSCNNLTITNNSVRDCGAEWEPGFWIKGDGHVVTKNVAHGNRGDGFRIGGNGISLDGNVAKENGIDGFDIHGGSVDSVTLTNNRAIGNGGEGIENNGSNAVVENNVSTGNRIDFATDGSEASFVGNVIQDGSDQATLPETD